MFDVQTVPSVASLLSHHVQFNLGIPILITSEHPNHLQEVF